MRAFLDIMSTITPESLIHYSVKATMYKVIILISTDG